MFTLVLKSEGCPNCDMLKRWLTTMEFIEGTYTILLASEVHFDWRPFCVKYGVKSVPALVNLDTEEVITNLEQIKATLTQYKKD